jgi:VCBS repeat-containing protein
MRMTTTAAAVALVAAAGMMVGVVGCERKETGGTAGEQPAASGDGTHEHDHDHAHDHDHDHADGHGHDHRHGEHGATIDLGVVTAGSFSVTAALGEGAVEAGKEVAVDLTITAVEGEAQVVAVRVWIGTEDAAGSIKARAEAEGGVGNWHAHVEAPSPLPEGSRLWVEVEDDRGELRLAMFDLASGG